jgi:hypothetical protein
MDTRYRGALDFGYKAAPVLGIAPNGRHVGAVRDGSEKKRTPKSRRVDLGVSVKVVYTSLLIPNSAIAERK